MPPPQAGFSGSDEDVEEEEIDPEDEGGDIMGEDLVAMEGEEDLEEEEEDALGKTSLAACPVSVSCHVTQHSHVPMLYLELSQAYTTIFAIRISQTCFPAVAQT
jgi:hypothetical protein